MAIVDHKAEEVFAGDIINKSLVKNFREKVKLPVYVLENLLSQNLERELVYEELEPLVGLVKEKLVNPKENLKIQAKIRASKTLTIIDKITAKAVMGEDKYYAKLLGLGAKKVIISNELVNKFPDILERGLWAQLSVGYLGDKATKKSEFIVKDLTPLQRTEANLPEFRKKVNQLSKFQWKYLLLRSIGIEPFNFSRRRKLLLLSRLIPFVEKNYNFIELGARETGKSFIYRQLSNESILVSGGKTTVANLFYNLGTRQVGLVGKREVVAFDEVAYVDFKDKTAIQMLKDYMESGTFSRGKEVISAEASMVFLGNINQDVHTLLHKSHLFKPLPEKMRDMALIDRFHFYLPGWEMKKLKESDFTDHYGLKTDYISMIFSQLRQQDYTHIIDEYYELDPKMNSRDKRAVRKTVSGFIKLLNPDGEVKKEELKLFLELALEGRKRVQEQLVKMGSFEYEEANFEYTDKETNRKYYPVLAEDRGTFEFKRKLARPGVVYIGQFLKKGQDFALEKMEIEMTPGSGKLFFKDDVRYSLKNNLRKTFILIKNRKSYLKLSKKMRKYDFYVSVNSLMKKVDADISNAFFICLYSLLTNKSVSSGLLVTEKSSIYRKPKFNLEVKALKAEGENGRIKTLLPLTKGRIFVEIPHNVIAEVPHFIVV